MCAGEPRLLGHCGEGVPFCTPNPASDESSGTVLTRSLGGRQHIRGRPPNPQRSSQMLWPPVLGGLWGLRSRDRSPGGSGRCVCASTPRPPCCPGETELSSLTRRGGGERGGRPSVGRGLRDQPHPGISWKADPPGSSRPICAVNPSEGSMAAQCAWGWLPGSPAWRLQSEREHALVSLSRAPAGLGWALRTDLAAQERWPSCPGRGPGGSAGQAPGRPRGGTGPGVRARTPPPGLA